MGSLIVVSRRSVLIRRTPRLQESPAHRLMGIWLPMEIAAQGDAVTRKQASKPLSNTATQKKEK